MVGGGLFVIACSPTVTSCTFAGNTAIYGGAIHALSGGNAALTGCTLSGNNSAGYGGGLYSMEGGNPTLSHCILSNNSANCGGGLYAENSSQTLTGCTLSGNSATNSGGGLYAYKSGQTLTGCTLSGNGAVKGGGLCKYDGILVMTDCTLSGNSATNHGGGFYHCHGGTATLTRCTFSNNEAVQRGGGVCNDDATANLTGCTLAGGSAFDGGGLFNAQSATLTNCTLSDNSATSCGGGLYNASGGTATLTNCTLSGGSAANGGGLYNAKNATLTACTLSGNSVPNAGGGLYNASGGTATLTNCTLSGNNAVNGGGLYNLQNATLTHCTWSGNRASAGSVVECAGSGSFTAKNSIFWDEGTEEFSGALWPTVTYCVVEGGSPGTGNRSANPNLGPLADNGGPTKTCALPWGSSAVDAGTDVGAPATDQRGVGRPKGAGYDMGAYELDPAAVTPTATPPLTAGPTPTSGPAPTAGPTPTTGPTPTPAPYPQPSGLPEPSVSVEGGTPLVYPTPAPPSDLPPTGTPNPPNLGLTPDMLCALLGAGIDTTLYQVVLTGQQGGTVTYRTTPGGVVTLTLPSSVHEENGLLYRWVCLVWDPLMGKWWKPSSARPETARGTVLLGETAVLRMADGGPYDLDGKADGLLAAKTLNVLLGVPKPGTTITIAPTGTIAPSGSSGSGGGGGGCSVGFAPGLALLLLAPLMARRPRN